MRRGAAVRTLYEHVPSAKSRHSERDAQGEAPMVKRTPSGSPYISLLISPTVQSLPLGHVRTTPPTACDEPTITVSTERGPW